MERVQIPPGSLTHSDNLQPTVSAMQISSVLSGYADATSGGRRSDSTERSTGHAGESQSSRGLSGTPTEAMRQVMADYDLTQITPQQYSEMLDRLRKGNAITEEEYSQLSQVRTELDSEGVGESEKVDLLSFYHQRSQRLSKQVEETSSDTAGRAALAKSLRDTQHRLDWLEKLEMVHAQPDSIGLDAVA
jgi:hypothetical protein